MKTLIEFIRHHYTPGYVRGRKQPSLLLTFRPTPALVERLRDTATTQQLHELFDAIAAYCGATTERNRQSAIDDWPTLITQLVATADNVLQYFQFPILDAPEIILAPEDNHWHEKPIQILQAVPHCDPSLCLKTLDLIIQITTHALQTGEFELPEAPLNRTLIDIKGNLKKNVSALFLRAAYSANIPVLALQGATMQYGHGAKSQWFEHTFSAQTSNISVRMARDKMKSSLRLRQAGLPVPPSTIVTNAEEAMRFGQQVGFPIVIKPANLDGGTAVTANLSTADEIRAAVQRVKKLSKPIRVEKHVAGRDYRLTVIDGRTVWAVERVPGGVMGDGEHTISQLIDLENRTLHRLPGPAQTLKPLSADGEAKALLAKQQLSLSDVPAEGQFVRLSSIANVATGGRPLPVFEQVHADNLELAERAAAALRLDIAGVDLLIPDIRRSWREVGAALCEVNAQPDLGATTALHLYGQVLSARLAGNGRIPVIAVVGGDKASHFIERIAAHTDTTKKLGWVTSNALGIGSKRLQTGKFKSFSGAQMLLTDPNVDAVLFQIAGEDAVRTGLPTDQLDLAIVCEAVSPMPLHQQIEKSLRPASNGRLITIEEYGTDAEAERAIKALLS